MSNVKIIIDSYIDSLRLRRGALGKQVFGIDRRLRGLRKEINNIVKSETHIIEIKDRLTRQIIGLGYKYMRDPEAKRIHEIRNAGFVLITDQIIINTVCDRLRMIRECDFWELLYQEPPIKCICKRCERRG